MLFVYFVQAESYAASVYANHFHVSAKQNKNLDEVFVDTTRKIIASKPRRGERSRIQIDGKSKPINIIDDEPSTSKSDCVLC